MEYTGWTGRNLGGRYKEYFRDLSSILDWFQSIDTTLGNFSIVGSEPQGFTRTIKEAMFIRVNNQPLNRNLGKYQLTHILMKCCRTYQFSIYNNPLIQFSTSPTAPNIGKHNHTFSSVDKYVSQGCFPLPTSTHTIHTTFLAQIPP